MNFMDYCFIVILVLSGFAGAYQGLVRSLIGIASIFFSFFVSIKFYHGVANAIKDHTPIYKMLNEASQNTLNAGITSMPGVDKVTQFNDEIINFLIGKIHVPPVLRDLIISKLNIDITNINTSQIIDTMSARTADIFVNILGFIIIFALLQFIFTILQFVVGGIFCLPVLSEINIIGGFGFGVLQGVVVLFVICAGWSMLSGVSMYHEVFVDLEASRFAKWFYNHNLLLDILVKYHIF